MIAEGCFHLLVLEVPHEIGTSETLIPFLLPHEICHAIAMAGSHQALC